MEEMNLVVAFSGSKVERGVKATKSGIFGKTWVAIKQHLCLHKIAVPGRRYQPLTGGGAPKRVSHLPSPKSSQRPQLAVFLFSEIAKIGTVM